MCVGVCVCVCVCVQSGGGGGSQGRAVYIMNTVMRSTTISVLSKQISVNEQTDAYVDKSDD